VRVLARAGRPAVAGAAETVEGDLEDAAALGRLLLGADVVIHNAGLVRARSSAEFHAVNRAGARRIAEIAAASTADTRFLLISSLAARRPELSAYAASKAAAEADVRAALSGRAFAILRPPAIYGPFDAATKPLFDAIRRGLAPRIGRKGCRVAMIHVDDAARAALAAASAADPTGPVFEVDDGAGGHSWDEIRAAAAAARGRRLLPAPIGPAVIRIGGALGSAAARLGLGAPFLTSGKAREILAGDWLVDPSRRPPEWSPEVSLQSGFSHTLACYRGRRQRAS